MTHSLLMHFSTDEIDASTLAALLETDEELALFDVREEGIYARSHLLFAGSLPLSELETRIGALVPRREALVVLTSGAHDGLAVRAARRCAALGYRNVRLLRGGNAAWEQAGHRLFKGIHVPSKAFGELVERTYRTPMIEAGELHALMTGGAKVEVFDSRPPHEFARMSLPGARNCPGADLLARIPAIVEDPQTLVVVNCAGRTRSIIGAQSLINAGVANKVVALKNGTMGWHLAGFALEHGKSRPVPLPAREELSRARELARGLREHFAVRTIDLRELGRMKSQRDRSLFILDVRGSSEYQRACLPDARNAPGGQLIQATDLYVGTRNARLVLVDDDGIRASVTASWLVQMGGFEVLVLDDASAESHFVECPAQAARIAHLAPPVDEIAADELCAALGRNEALLLDLQRSEAHSRGHIPGARFAIRSRFAQSLPRLARHAFLVLTSEDGVLARFAAAEAAAHYGAPVRVLAGGNAAWRAQGRPLETGLEGALDEPEDMWHIPSSPLGGGEPAMKEYLSWEINLIEQIEGEPGIRFRLGMTMGDLGDAETSDERRVWMDVAPMLRRRWSSRAMSGEPLSDAEVLSLFEAARWAPSASNSQPWRFLYARRDTAHWQAFFELLSEGNRRWAGEGALLAVMLSARRDATTGKPFATHSFDAGAAWQNIALQGDALGLVTHAMRGFDVARARTALGIPEDFDIEAMFVAGRAGRIEDLPVDLQRREVPSGRLPLRELVFEGRLPQSVSTSAAAAVAAGASPLEASEPAASTHRQPPPQAAPSPVQEKA